MSAATVARRRLYVVPLVALLAAAVLGVLAAAARPPAPRSLSVEAAAPLDSDRARLWPVAVRLDRAPSAVDVVLQLRLAGGRTAGRALSVEVCRTASCTDAEQVWASTGPLRDGTVAVGRVGSVEPTEALHLGVRLYGGSDRHRPVLAVNASPCAAPTASQLWTRQRTAVPARPNTLAGLENCAGRPLPYLPFALEALGAGTAIVLASRRVGP